MPAPSPALTGSARHRDRRALRRGDLPAAQLDLGVAQDAIDVCVDARTRAGGNDRDRGKPASSSNGSRG